MMHGREKSDPAIVARKPANNAGQPAAERVERRAGTEGNAGQQSTRRAQDRESVSQALERVRQAARQRRKERFTALPPPQLRNAAYRVLRAEAGRGGGRRRGEVAGLRSRSRSQDRRFERSGPSGSLSGAALAASVHTEARWAAASAGSRRP